ncbi:MAG: hypothetical protein AAB655_02290 [Patescibacteria group bacterium]
MNITKTLAVAQASFAVLYGPRYMDMTVRQRVDTRLTHCSICKSSFVADEKIISDGNGGWRHARNHPEEVGITAFISHVRIGRA